MDVLDSAPPRAIRLLLRAEMPSVFDGEGAFAAATFTLPDILPLDAAPTLTPSQAEEAPAPPPPEAEAALAEDAASAQPPPLSYPVQRNAVILRLAPAPRHPDTEIDHPDAAPKADMGRPSTPPAAPPVAATALLPQTDQSWEHSAAPQAPQGEVEFSGAQSAKMAETSANTGPSTLLASDITVEASADPPAALPQVPKAQDTLPYAPQNPAEDAAKTAQLSPLTPIVHASLAGTSPPRQQARDIALPKAVTQPTRVTTPLETTPVAFRVNSEMSVAIDPIGANRHAPPPALPEAAPSLAQSRWHDQRAPLTQHAATPTQGPPQGPSAPSAQDAAGPPQGPWQEPSAPSAQQTAPSAQGPWLDRSATTAQHPVTPPPVTRPMPELQAELNTRSGEVALEIEPDDLGALRITLRPEGETLRIALQASREEGMEFLRKNSPALENSLEDSGFRHRSFNFEDWHEADPRPKGDARPREDAAPETSGADRHGLALGGRVLNLRL